MKIALIGYGKMGKAIEQETENWSDPLHPRPEIILRFHSRNRQDLVPENLRRADVAIEFTTPETAVENILKCFEAGIPVVCGTTGWQHRLPEVQERCKALNGTLFYASNFSIGVHVFFELNRLMARLMNTQTQYDVRLYEIHHTEKKDAPSGTAITLAEELIKIIDRKTKWVPPPASAPEELEIQSIREKDVPGIHGVTYHSDIDTIEITHTAHSRRGFALGALQAAMWVKGKKGIFGMKDLLSL
ncbi:MAG: 4-hydroxy-tetrahydrodipicolinate reductase [Chitinophagales bacterium]|nr:MAG: 4-hydroxy-tetrahydrodipicolinate reductase [Chitinophagales bacterium]